MASADVERLSALWDVLTEFADAFNVLYMLTEASNGRKRFWLACALTYLGIAIAFGPVGTTGDSTQALRMAAAGLGWMMFDAAGLVATPDHEVIFESLLYIPAVIITVVLLTWPLLIRPSFRLSALTALAFGLAALTFCLLPTAVWCIDNVVGLLAPLFYASLAMIMFIYRQVFSSETWLSGMLLGIVLQLSTYVVPLCFLILLVVFGT
jgi:hypothetical protein